MKAGGYPLWKSLIAIKCICLGPVSDKREVVSYGILVEIHLTYTAWKTQVEINIKGAGGWQIAPCRLSLVNINNLWRKHTLYQASEFPQVNYQWTWGHKKK